MGRRTQRRRAARLVEDFVADLRLPVPAEPEQVMSAVCEVLTQRLGHPVKRMPVKFPASQSDVVFGLWVHADDGHYIFYEKDTSPWHQLVIFCHETGHLIHEHDQTPLLDSEGARLLLPSLDPSAVQRIMAKRSRQCHGPAEIQAEMFAAHLLTHVSRWLPEKHWNVADSAVDAVHRMENTFGLPQASDRG
ncbi:hypothetical protein NDR87_34215 [Nocardia sp. CDC159]|uniref:IrrE N-terminal-like domain-containing protein n=1 Tax=Nocardia pulmonis TaxID=2951408 RepID=A0A9X2EDX2_9NOCA|nr:MULTISPECIES: hypothetical protein [Nocardia]MCM6778550.1 hypothetical protein [Nocardia pulmonis]MCM6791439.1 hypothetical protein [Nocardia sp. CDC159]